MKARMCHAQAIHGSRISSERATENSRARSVACRRFLRPYSDLEIADTTKLFSHAPNSLSHRTFLNQSRRCHTQAAVDPSAPANAPATPQRWYPSVGLEIHAQIATATKLFSHAPNSFSHDPNVAVAPLDAAIPGTLPALSREAVVAAVKTGLALNCQLNAVSEFDRKHYFYFDLPAGYQITQQRRPVAADGWFDYYVFGAGVARPYRKRVAVLQMQLVQEIGQSTNWATDCLGHVTLVNRNQAGCPCVYTFIIVFQSRSPLVQLEQDSGRDEVTLINFNRTGCSCTIFTFFISDSQLHSVQLEQDSGQSMQGVTDDGAGEEVTLVNLNRAGCPLLEIIFEPACHSGVEASCLVRVLEYTLRRAGVCSGRMEHGSLRVDANISVAERRPRKRWETQRAAAGEERDVENVSRQDGDAEGGLEREIHREENVSEEVKCTDERLGEVNDVISPSNAVATGHAASSHGGDAPVIYDPLDRVDLGSLGVRTEVKNINGFTFVGRAVDYEIGRHIALRRAGKRVAFETRNWELASGETVRTRSKETTFDYRYMPEPNLPPLRLAHRRSRDPLAPDDDGNCGYGSDGETERLDARITGPNQSRPTPNWEQDCGREQGNTAAGGGPVFVDDFDRSALAGIVMRPLVEWGVLRDGGARVQRNLVVPRLTAGTTERSVMELLKPDYAADGCLSEALAVMFDEVFATFFDAMMASCGAPAEFALCYTAHIARPALTLKKTKLTLDADAGAVTGPLRPDVAAMIADGLWRRQLTTGAARHLTARSIASQWDVAALQDEMSRDGGYRVESDPELIAQRCAAIAASHTKAVSDYRRRSAAKKPRVMAFFLRMLDENARYAVEHADAEPIFRRILDEGQEAV